MQTSPPQTPGQPDALSHPSREEWMAYLYGELSGELQSRLKAHLKACPQCRGQVAHWRTTMRALDEWIVPAPAAATRPAAASFFQPVLRWAVAAAIVLGLGIGLGRLSSPASADMQALRRSLEKELRAETERVLTELARSSEEIRAKDNRAIVAALQQLDTKWSAMHASLRNALETVAVLTEDGLHDTQQQLYQLANLTQPSANP